MLHYPLDGVFHALSDPTRRHIVERLTGGPQSVSALAAPLEMTLAAALQHIQVLEASGVVRTEKVGRTRVCRLDPRALTAAEKWLIDRRVMRERRFESSVTFARPLEDARARNKKTRKP